MRIFSRKLLISSGSEQMEYYFHACTKPPNVVRNFSQPYYANGQMSADNLFQPTLLIDKSRIQEIYDLRVDVWEHSAKQEFVNRRLFPKGWFDELDQLGHNFIVTDTNKIIAAARLNCFNTLKSFPFYEDIKQVGLPADLPFGYYSRLVVSENYQGKGISQKLDQAIIGHATNLKLKWIVGLSSNRTNIMVQKLNFINHGTANIRYHNNSNFHLVDVIIKHL
ncbi:MAG: GNAT family N-acetyltransferase [Agriterribacter sp.]